MTSPAEARLAEVVTDLGPGTILTLMEELNQIVWMMSETLGDVPPEAETIEANALDVCERLIAELVQLRQEKEQWIRSGTKMISQSQKDLKPEQQQPATERPAA